ncbi:MAG: DUF3800 domain-containing protein [Nitrospira sp.]|nr:DUF3800 domain-containing protein [Nitrospira sp.]
MLKAYSDESGHSGDSRYVCMGGCVATVEAWARFVADWRKALDDEDLEEFHMTEFENGSGDFVKYKNNPLAHKAFLARLMAIMEEHVAIYVVSTEIVYRDAPRKPINADSPFYSCLYGILDSVTSYAGTLDLSERVEMVFADNKEGASLVLDEPFSRFARSDAANPRVDG